MGTSFKIGLIWIATVIGEIFLAFVYPVITGLFDNTATATLATGDPASHHILWSVLFIRAMSLIVWFIIPGIALTATVVWLREEKS